MTNNDQSTRAGAGNFLSADEVQALWSPYAGAAPFAFARKIEAAIAAKQARAGWRGLTEEERAAFVNEICEYGTDFVSPLFALAESLENVLKARNSTAAPAAAPAQAGAQWRRIVEPVRHLIGRQFRDEKGVIWTFFGVVDGDDDYYYGMHNTKLTLLSCVGSIEGHGFELVEDGAAPEIPCAATGDPA